MISNKTILDKLTAKTADSPAVKKFLLNALEIESEGKNYKKPFTAGIKQGVKEEKEGAGK